MKHRINLKPKKYPDKIEGIYPGGDWQRWEFDNNGNFIYYECSNGWWESLKYNNGKVIYFEDCTGYWVKTDRDDNGMITYIVNSNGYVLYETQD